MKKTTGHKFHIERALLDRNWEIISVEHPIDWHIDELWILKSTRINWVMKVQVEFSLDPHPYSLGRLDEVEIRTLDSQREEGLITTICLTKGHFRNALSDSMIELDEFRKNEKLF